MTRRRHLTDAEMEQLMTPRLQPLRALVEPAMPESSPPGARSTPRREAKPRQQRSPARSPINSPTAAAGDRGHAPDGPTPGASGGALSQEERELLESILDRPLLSATQRRDYLGMSTYGYDRLKKGVLKNDFAEELTINLGAKTRGTIKLLELTTAGHEALDRTAPKPRPANCSGEHWWWQRRIAAWYRGQAMTAETEMNRAGKRADVGVIIDGRAVAIEVALTPKNEAANVQQDLKAGFGTVIVACKNARVKAAVYRRLQGALDEAQARHVRLMLLAEFSFVEDMGRAS